jgi:hypothetical protein
MTNFIGIDVLHTRRRRLRVKAVAASNDVVEARVIEARDGLVKEGPRRACGAC